MAPKTLDLADVEYLRQAVPALQKVVPWTVGWSCLYAVFRFGALRTRTAGFSNRVVSLLHAIVAIFMCARCLPTWGALLENVGGMNTTEHLECMTLSLSYFVYDFLYCLLDNDVENVIHHLFTIGGLASGVITGRSGPELVGCLFLMEVSNPSLHLRTLLREMNMKDSVLATLNDLTFALLFLFCRLIVGPPLVYKTVVNESNTYIVKIGALGILIVSLMWGWKIIMMIVRNVRKLFGGAKAKAKKP
jgi:hypothetical protein